MTKPELDLPSIDQIIDIVRPDRASRAEVGEYIGSLVSLYEAPERSHHNFSHIQEMVREYLRYQEHTKSMKLVTWSALLHDAVYDPKAAPGVNEEMSATKATQDLPAFLPYMGVVIVARYVRATAKHATYRPSNDLQLFLDSDLWVLGSPEDRYSRYSADIRQEYAHVDPDTYRSGRIEALQDLSTRVEGKYVFQTNIFRDNYETQAQKNIANEIKELRREGGALA